MSSDKGIKKRCVVRLLIIHPSVDARAITEALSLKPQLSLSVGQDRQTPGGRHLPGKNKSTIWSHAYNLNSKGPFFKKTAPFLARLERNSEYLKALSLSGGKVHLIFELDGRQNQGDTISSGDMERLARLDIDVGIEVFPNFQPV